MIMNVSRATIEKIPFVVDDHWLISITDTNKQPANITANFKKVFRFSFDDIISLREETFGFKRISKEQAEEIANILIQAKTNCVPLWVHCEAGICRSGAVVEAAISIGFVPDDEISEERCPNKFVLKAIQNFLRKYNKNKN